MIFGDTEIGPGTTVMPVVAAANRDPRVFVAPDETRRPPTTQGPPRVRLRPALLPGQRARADGGRGVLLDARPALPDAGARGRPERRWSGSATRCSVRCGPCRSCSASIEPVTDRSQQPAAALGRIGLGLWTMRSTAFHPRNRPAAYAAFVDDAVLTERLGFHSIWTAEHRHWYDGWAPAPLHAQASAIAATSRLRFGHAVMLLAQHDAVALGRRADDLRSPVGRAGGVRRRAWPSRRRVRCPRAPA